MSLMLTDQHQVYSILRIVDVGVRSFTVSPTSNITCSAATTVPVTAVAANKTVSILVVIYVEKCFRLQSTSRK